MPLLQNSKIESYLKIMNRTLEHFTLSKACILDFFSMFQASNNKEYDERKEKFPGLVKKSQIIYDIDSNTYL